MRVCLGNSPEGNKGLILGEILGCNPGLELTLPRFPPRPLAPLLLTFCLLRTLLGVCMFIGLSCLDPDETLPLDEGTGFNDGAPLAPIVGVG